jgi:uncharacterized integral membrane protein
MATIADIADPIPRVQRRDRFFLILTLAMIAVIVGGFSLNLATGRSSFALPLIYHVHAAIFMGWLLIFLAQTVLIASNNARLHRRLGWIALIWVPMMVGMGLAMTLYSMRAHGGPPFFAAGEFLFGNPAGLLCFAGLVGAAVTVRGRSDWHRRLMLCSLATITGPGLGRILPVPFMIPWSWTVSAWLAPLVFPLIGMAGDYARTRRVHPAWLWGIAAMTGSFLIGQAVAFSPWGESIVRSALAGTPGAARPLAAHWPPMP